MKYPRGARGIKYQPNAANKYSLVQSLLPVIPMIHPAPLFVAAAAVFGAWLYFSTDTKRNPHKLPTPPGPKGWPFIRNMFDMPQKNAWEVVMKLRKQYGDLIFMNVLGTPILYINSLEVARELLDKRSSAYSDRPVLPMAGELCGYKEVTPLLPARAVRFRAERKLMHQYMGTRASVEKIADVEEEENARLCLRILRDPSSERLRSHIRKTAGGIILKLAYGYDPKEHMDPFVEQADRMLRQWDMATMPGAYLVDILPALKHIPEWFPGAGFKRFARSCNRELTRMFDLPFEWAMSNRDKSSEIPNLVSGFHSDSLSKEDARDVKMAAGNLYAGGTDTTVSASYCLFLILAKYPEVQARAQAEVDRVVGMSRLPRMSDRSKLPYIDAMVKELLRWNAVTPLAFPHMSSEDDTYDGYFIPKGTIVMPNTYCMLRDEATYRDPDRFNPDRFLSNGGNPPEQDPRDMCFGFGRRVCPGLHVADASLFMFCATVAAVFNVSKAVKDGVEVEPEYETIGTVITHPKHFEVSIDARSQVAVQLVKSAAELNE